jgi:hypothetical protein
MQDSLLWQVLETFSKKDFRDFRKFINSPYFNQKAELVALFEYYHQCILAKKENLSKEKAFNKLMPNVKFNDVKLRLANSEILELIEHFWIVEAAISNNFNSKLSVAIQYRQRNLDKHYHRIDLEIEQQTEKFAYRNGDFHIQNYYNKIEAHRYHIIKKRENIINPKAMWDSLDNAYYTLKLRQACIEISAQNVYRADNQNFIDNDFLTQIEKKELYRTPSIAIYYYAFMCQSQPENESYFLKLRTALADFGHLFPNEEIRDLYLIAINFCIKKHNEGKDNYLKFELELYEEGLKNKYLYINNRISRFTYRNVVTLALTLKEFDWAAKFIEIYKDDLEEANKIGNYNYCQARLAYEQKDYDAVFRLLQKADYNEVLMNLAAKALLLKVFYETSAFDTLEAHLEAMRTYIRRKVFLSYQQENYLNLIVFTKKMLKNQVANLDKIIELKDSIISCKALAERKWLLDMIEKL